MNSLRVLKILTVVMLTLVLVSGTTVYADSIYYDDFSYSVYSNDEIVMPYRLYVPKASTEPLPLILFLHGAGSCGVDNEAQLREGAVPYLLNEGHLINTPAIVLAPQCAPNEKWVDTPWEKGGYSVDLVEESAEVKAVIEILSNVVSTYNVDLSRIYVTGISMGGFGTWDLITRYPDVFAAAIPICGAGDASKGDVLASSQTNIWAFHGTADPVVPYSGTQNTIDAILNAGGSPAFTSYQGTKHDAWSATYSNPKVFEWLFAQSLDDLTSIYALLGIETEEPDTSSDSLPTPDDTDEGNTDDGNLPDEKDEVSNVDTVEGRSKLIMLPKWFDAFIWIIITGMILATLAAYLYSMKIR